MKKLLIAAGFAFLGFVGLAVSQVITVPQVLTLSPGGSLSQTIPGGIPSAQNQYATAGLVTNVYGYYKSPSAFTTNFLYTFGSAAAGVAPITYAQFESSSTVNTGYIYLAAAPSDGTLNCFYSKSAITNVTLYAGVSSQTLNDAITTAAALTQYCYLYSASNTSWDRVK